MTRRWHVEHANGRPWDRIELDSLVRRTRRAEGRPVSDEGCEVACIDQNGEVYLLDTYGDWNYVMDDEDLVVVWDDRLD